MSKHKDSTFQMRVDESELTLAKKRAAQQGLSLSTIMRFLMGRFIDDPEIALGAEESDERAEYDHAHAKSRRDD